MAVQLDIELRDKVMQYLSGKLPLAVFEDWFAPFLWNIEQPENSELQVLASNIARLLAEYSRGDRSIEELHQELRSVASTYSRSDSMVVTGATLSFSPTTFPREWPSADILFSRAFSLQFLP